MFALNGKYTIIIHHNVEPSTLQLPHPLARLLFLLAQYRTIAASRSSPNMYV